MLRFSFYLNYTMPGTADIQPALLHFRSHLLGLRGSTSRCEAGRMRDTHSKLAGYRCSHTKAGRMRRSPRSRQDAGHTHTKRQDTGAATRSQKDPGAQA